MADCPRLLLVSTVSNWYLSSRACQITHHVAYISLVTYHTLLSVHTLPHTSRHRKSLHHTGVRQETGVYLDDKILIEDITSCLVVAVPNAVYRLSVFSPDHIKVINENGGCGQINSVEM